MNPNAQILQMNPISQLVDNARALGHQSQTVAAAGHLLGKNIHSLCVWCAEHESGDVWRLPKGGECDRCSYVGHDCLVVSG